VRWLAGYPGRRVSFGRVVVSTAVPVRIACRRDPS
jgi:hypothetical protein